MKPTIEDIIQRGYFPKELPPPFNTFMLSHYISEITSEWEKFFVGRKFDKKMSSTCPVKYSIAKGKFSRRYLSIPNPIHFLSLINIFNDLWEDMTNIINQSTFSQSKPLANHTITKRAIKISSSGFSDFIKQTLKASLNKKVELRLDISKFYPSIYTHSIPWAILGKNKAKEIFNEGDKEIYKKAKGGYDDYSLYSKADLLDKKLRACQSNQTIGIPIGPDTSFVIAELINSRIDIEIQTEFSDVTGCRYYDDYYLYTNTIAEAEQVLKFVQEKYFEFGLNINESKVSIKQLPTSFMEDFQISISNINFKNRFEYTLKLYFNTLWSFAELHPQKMGQIFRYGLKMFEENSINIPKMYWNLFEDLLFKTTLYEPTILNVTCNILSCYSPYLNQESVRKLGQIIYVILEEHIPLKQSLEVSWALWICKKFKIEIEKKCFLKY